MKTYEPRIDIRLVKANRRKQIVDGLPVATDRYGQMSGFDLTQFLGEHGGVRLSKSVREPAGAFSITLTDRPHLAETIYALVEPMDVVIIRMAHDPHKVEYKKGDPDHGLPVVMRGLVSNITRNETISGNKPVRTVTIAGQDFGKILSIIQIYYLNNSSVGDNIASSMAWFKKYSEMSSAKIMPAEEWLIGVDGVLDKVINPFIDDILRLADTDALAASNTTSLSAEVFAEGSVSPYMLSHFKDVSLHQMLSTVLDVGAWNELYVEDRPSGPYLVVRPVPFSGADSPGYPIQTGAWVDRLTIESDDVVAMNVMRSDQGVANYFWVSNQSWAMVTNQTAKEMAQYGTKESFQQFEHPNCAMSIYGVRKMELQTSLGDPEFSYTESAKAEVISKNRVSIAGWMEKRRNALVAMNRDNVVFESGTIRLRGNESIKAGMVLTINRGRMASQYYAHRVDHDFVPYQGFFTTVTVDRGTGFIDRAQEKDTPFYGSSNPRGVS